MSLISDILEKYKVICPLSDNKAKGVGFIVNNKFSITNFGFFDNNCVFVDVDFKNEIFKLINVYSPNCPNEQIKYIEKIYDLCVNSKKNIILAGDFNCVIDAKNLNNRKINQREWAKFVKTFDFYEIKNTSEKNFTWTNGINKTYIDKFLVKFKNESYECEYKNNIKTSMSDHNMVVVNIKIISDKNSNKNKYQKANQWKLNETVLENDYVNNYIIEKCKNIKYLINRHKNEWYEFFIKDIIRMLKNESKKLNTEKK